jgi:hypothetical protein
LQTFRESGSGTRQILRAVVLKFRIEIGGQSEMDEGKMERRAREIQACIEVLAMSK